MAILQQFTEDGTLALVDTDTGMTVTTATEQQTASNPTSWADIVKLGLTTLQTAQINQINVERARRGLPPLDTAQYTGVGVRVGLNPQTQQLLIYGGLALLAVMLLRRR